VTRSAEGTHRSSRLRPGVSLGHSFGGSVAPRKVRSKFVGQPPGWRPASGVDEVLSRRNEISCPLGPIVEHVTCDDVNFSGLVVPFRLLSVNLSLCRRGRPGRTAAAGQPAAVGLVCQSRRSGVGTVGADLIGSAVHVGRLGHRASNTDQRSDTPPPLPPPWCPRAPGSCATVCLPRRVFRGLGQQGLIQPVHRGRPVPSRQRHQGRRMRHLPLQPDPAKPSPGDRIGHFPAQRLLPQPVPELQKHQPADRSPLEWMDDGKIDSHRPRLIAYSAQHDDSIPSSPRGRGHRLPQRTPSVINTPTFSGRSS
jgi:hypothetical protein